MLVGGRILGGVMGLLLILATAVFAATPFGLPSGKLINAQLEIPAGPFTIGDRITILLTVETKKDLTYQLPDFPADGLGGLELKDKKILSTEEFPQGTRKRIQYTLIGWQTGKFSLPALTIEYQTTGEKKESYQLPGSTLEIVSVLPKDKSNTELAALEVKPLKKPLGLPPDYHMLGYFLIGIAFVGLISLGLRRLIAKTIGPESKIIIKEPADIIAFRRLTILKNSDYLNQSEFKVFYSELSECVREYMENRFRTKALEMTTEEFLAYLTTVNLVNQEHQLMLRQTLSTADLVKFAKQNPPISEAETALLQVEQFITATKETDANENSGLNEEKNDDLS